MTLAPNSDNPEAYGLSLSITKGNIPFALTSEEEDFTSEDWAWQFLRLNSEYIEGYRSRFSKSNGKFSAQDRRYCRRTFGLSDWLDPGLTRLPDRDESESWFYPLMDVPFSPESALLPDSHVGTYGYQAPRHAHRHFQTRNMLRHRAAFGSPYVWFAVDCSIPPEAQLRGIENMVRSFKACLKASGATIRRTNGNDVIKRLIDCRWFNHADFDTAFAKTENVSQISELWRAIRIDVLKPPKQQLEICKSALAKVHEMLVEHRLAHSTFRERYRHQVRSSAHSAITDGSWIKGLVIVAELSQKFESAHEIEDDIASRAGEKEGKQNPSNAWLDWLSGREDRIKTRMELADQLVTKHGYLWLINSQKPR